MLTRALVVAVALGVSPVQAAEETDGETDGWSGEGEFGLVVTTGNTETETLNARLKGAHERDDWTFRAGLVALSSSEEDETTAERYEATGKAEHRISDRSYRFGSLRYEDDRFSGFDYQGIFTVGYGRTVWEQEDSQLDMEAGIGVRRTREAASSETPDPEAMSDGILRGAAAYWWQFTENARLQNDFLVETGEDNTFVQNQLALRVAVNSRFSVKLGYEVRHNTDVPEDTEETDTISTVNLVYSFQ